MIFIFVAFSFIILFLLIMHALDKSKRDEITKKYEGLLLNEGNTVVIEGTKLYYLEQGSGFPIVIIHGFMCSCIDFENIIKAFSIKYKVIAVDLIGFGRSDKRKTLNYSKKNMGELIHKLMRQKGYKIYSIVGHSMGGGVALNIANDHPESINSLVLVDSVGYKNPKRMPVPPILLEIVLKSFYIQKLFYKICLYDISKADYERFEKVYFFNCEIPSKTLYTFSRIDDSETIEGNIGGIGCPTLIIWGKHDRITKLESAYKFRKDIKSSSIVIFENSGHMPYAEEEEKFIKVLTQFFQKVI